MRVECFEGRKWDFGAGLDLFGVRLPVIQTTTRSTDYYTTIPTWFELTGEDMQHL